MSSHLIYDQAVAPTTAGLWRFSTMDWSAVLKLIRHSPEGDSPWVSTDSPDHWYYWRREAAAYESGVLDDLDPLLRPPRCHGVFERPGGGVAIWLEDLRAAAPASDWTIARYGEAAAALGRFQARSGIRGTTHGPGLARDWIVGYLERHEPSSTVLADTEAWRHPLLEGRIPSELPTEITELWTRRHELLELARAAGRCLTHSDLHPGNLYAFGPETVVIDWAFTGEGPLGEDPGNLVFDTVLDFFVPPEDFPRLCEAVFDSYEVGAMEGGWTARVDVLRRAMLAVAAVKFLWIPPAMVGAVAAGRDTLNRRPLEEAVRWWAPVIPFITDFGRVALGGAPRHTNTRL